MNSKNLGLFIAEQRKALGLTQSELAEKLYVTDKAVSRWERGVGLPDINLLEPLADALEVTVSELIVCKKEEKIGLIEPSNAVKEVINYVEQKKIEQKKFVYICLSVCFLVFMIMLIDQMGMLGFIGVIIPLVALAIGLSLLAYAIFRKKKKQSTKQALMLALLFLLVPFVYFLLFLLIGMLGIGPIPL